MAIINVSGSPTKGTPTLITLNKTNLSNHVKVLADSYFSDSTKWKTIVLFYNSTTSNQKETITFNASLPTPTSYAYIDTFALGDFYIQKLVIRDNQHGSFILERSDLNAGEFDLIYGSLMNNDWDILFNYLTTTGGGQLKHGGLTGTNGWNNCAGNSNAITGNFTFSGSIKTSSSGTDNLMVGYKKSLLTIADSDPVNNITSAIYVTSANLSTLFIGTFSTASLLTSPSFSNNTIYSFEIKRIGSSITIKFNNVLMATDNYSGNIFLGGVIFTPYVTADSELLSTSLI